MRRQGIQQLGNSSGSYFVLFSMKVSRGHGYSCQGKSLAPWPQVTALNVLKLKQHHHMLTIKERTQPLTEVKANN